jgi:hypothetical protein
MGQDRIDPRYSIDLEWCGYDTPRFAVRFCGNWVGQSSKLKLAQDMAIQHNTNRF